MANETKQAVAALRRSHDELDALVGGMSPTDLTKPSACTEWTIAQVLSHLGSAAEIGLATLTSGEADMDASQAIWDRWNAMSPEEQATGFRSAGEALVQGYESLSDEELSTKKLKLGFLPAPVDIAFFAGMRLSEVGLHRWDIDVAFAATPEVADYLVAVVIQSLPAFAGYFAKPIGRDARVSFHTTKPDGHYLLELNEDGATFAQAPADTDSGTTVNLPAESLLRLTSGRLRPDHTPVSVRVTGDLSLDDLRRIFPGY
ncbi:MAG TPA: maleylpyruvate isomerase family mycothiol-dependent enzyme [Acidimicrobiales bacterium]|jgi:uncharacterized protein (TIGR03083 family)|nr:maleylpyruvate isomerase family mycothiol-dependent enzyme [Acidimicrobiales bacterium]